MLFSIVFYPIASRCGVFAKSDIQPILNQGGRKEDVAASIFQAVVDQTVCVRDIGVHRCGGGVYLLHKVQPRRLGHPQPGGAGDDQLDGLAGQPAGEGAQGLAGKITLKSLRK